MDTACVLGSGEGDGTSSVSMTACSYDDYDNGSSTECATTGYNVGGKKRTQSSISSGRAGPPALHSSCSTAVCDEKNSSSRHPPSNSRRMIHAFRDSRSSNSVCSVNKKNRYRSWVYHRVMHKQQQQQNQPRVQSGARAPKNAVAMGSMRHAGTASPMHMQAGGGCTSSFSTHKSQTLQQDSSRVGELIQSYVEDVLCSPKWQMSMDTEDLKTRAKKRSLTLKAFKMMLKCHEPVSSLAPAHQGRDASNFARICIPEAAALVASMMGNFRRPCAAATLEERRVISGWCSETIHRHICLVNSMCQGVVTDAKIKTTTIGLLYMMRQVFYSVP